MDIFLVSATVKSLPASYSSFAFTTSFSQSVGFSSFLVRSFLMMVPPKTRNRNSRFSELKPRRPDAMPLKNTKDIRTSAKCPSLNSLSEMSTGIRSVAAIKANINAKTTARISNISIVFHIFIF
nr:hypothetical protein GZ27B6_13 [uncultured archaeon GZfos27B6]